MWQARNEKGAEFNDHRSTSSYWLSSSENLATLTALGRRSNYVSSCRWFVKQLKHRFQNFADFPLVWGHACLLRDRGLNAGHNCQHWKVEHDCFHLSVLTLSKTHQLTLGPSIPSTNILEALSFLMHQDLLIELIISPDKTLAFGRKTKRKSRYLVDIVPESIIETDMNVHLIFV